MPLVRRFHLRRVMSRLDMPEPRTLFFVAEGGSRSRPARFFRPEEVPPFEGECAVFEAERVDGRWRILRQVTDAAPWTRRDPYGR